MPKDDIKNEDKDKDKKPEKAKVDDRGRIDKQEVVRRIVG